MIVAFLGIFIILFQLNSKYTMIVVSLDILGN